jgi:DNA-binding response OmpR family regulator
MAMQSPPLNPSARINSPEGLRVFTVSADVRATRLLRDALTELSCLVCGHAYTGAAAALMAERFLPDLMVIDIHLRDGMEAAQVIQAQLGIPVLFVGDQPDLTTSRCAPLRLTAAGQSPSPSHPRASLAVTIRS